MKHNKTLSHSHRDDRSKSLRSEDTEVLLSRSEEERLRRKRREWMIQREKERKHEELKRQKILEFEIEYARKRGLPLPERYTQYNHSKSKSRSPDNQHGRKDSSSKPKTSILSEKLDGTDGTTPLFKGPEGTKFSASELRQIKVDIHRNIPKSTTATTTELQREIVNPEDVLVKRREGEGSKPIFEREELKVSKSDEVEEHRTVVAVNNEKLEGKSKIPKRYTVFSRSRSHSPRRTSSRLSRYEDRESDRNDRNQRRSRDKSRDKRYGTSREFEEANSRQRRSRRHYSHSRESEERKWDRGFHRRSVRDERSHREYRGRSRERSKDRMDRSREHGIPHYVEQISVPIYYGNFPPRPMMVGPLVPFRGPLVSRHAPMMGPMRPLPPRFVPPNMYRLPPPNSRFRPM